MSMPITAERLQEEALPSPTPQLALREPSPKARMSAAERYVLTEAILQRLG